jgi:hypothetical protein
VYWFRERIPFNDQLWSPTQMSMPTPHPASLETAAGPEAAARRRAYRRLAATILGLDVHSLAAELQAQRTGNALDAVALMELESVSADREPVREAVLR